jgi:hypothetical protein
MSKTIALFRYHKDAEVCANHLELFRKYNPEIEVHGVFGGEIKEYEELKTILNLSSDYFIKNISVENKWKSFDFVLKEWYANRGKHLNFDRVFLLEWDFIIFKPLTEVFPNLNSRQLAFSGLVPMKKIEHKWYWTKSEVRKPEWEALKVYVKDKYNYTEPDFACVCPGMNISREFLESMESTELPEYCNDEVRFPVYAGIGDFELMDTGFFKKWFSKREYRYFNCNGFDVQEKIIRRELKRNSGRRVFHPYRKVFNNLN